MALSRRELASGLVRGLVGAATLSGVTQTRAQTRGNFQHGVASGDPLQDRVILWTRVTPAAGNTAAIPVRWRIALDENMRSIVEQGELMATAARDFTLKLDVMGLEPSRTYYYQFDANGEVSPTGRTRTLPLGIVKQMRFAVASCSNFPFGYFNVYANIAARPDLDAVLHLGDYIYEYAPKEYGDGTELGRQHQPPREIVSLADYRLRHAQYKSDPDLQEAHRQHPWITIWDDHESANNSYREGAQNHNPDKGEGSWAQRKGAAMRAYAEWMPIREIPDDEGGLKTFRRFSFGNLGDLIMLDTRLYGRDAQAEKGDDATIAQNQRSILGADQEAWLAMQLRRSQQRGAKYRILGQQLLMGQLLDAERKIVNTDMWDGYLASRQRLFDQIRQERIDNLVVLSGDVHSAWAMDLTPDPFQGYSADNGNGSLGVEMVTTSVTSPSPFGNAQEAQVREQATLKNLPHAKWLNFQQRGYLLLDVNSERAQGEWYFVDSVSQRGSADQLGGVLLSAAGENRLQAGKLNASRGITDRPDLIAKR